MAALETYRINSKAELPFTAIDSTDKASWPVLFQL